MENLSTRTVDDKGNVIWKQNGYLHRNDGPAIELIGGGKEWYIKSKRHREDGPAIEHSSGAKEWYINDLRHNEKGPAVIGAGNNFESWYIKGIKLTEEEFNLRSILIETGLDGII